MQLSGTNVSIFDTPYFLGSEIIFKSAIGNGCFSCNRSQQLKIHINRSLYQQEISKPSQWALIRIRGPPYIKYCIEYDAAGAA